MNFSYSTHGSAYGLDIYCIGSLIYLLYSTYYRSVANAWEDGFAHLGQKPRSHQILFVLLAIFVPMVAQCKFHAQIIHMSTIPMQQHV